MATTMHQMTRHPLPSLPQVNEAGSVSPLEVSTAANNFGHWNNNQDDRVSTWRSWMKKYVILCLICGFLSVLLGVLFILLFFTLRSYTSSLQFFETIPTYVPAIILIVNGLIVMCFAKRKNRYNYLVKITGGWCLICALICVVITVTTTVVHMNRLQALHECVYTSKAKTCMCMSAINDPSAQDGIHRFVFHSTPNCEVVHGSLYACLRALFGLSVIGILICIFTSMLIYQLLSHEKKKLYWEQLEVRRRFLYRRPSHQHYSICNCFDDVYWRYWEDADYRQINSSTSVGERNDRPPRTNNTEQNGSNQRSSNSWNWLRWPWNGERRSGNPQLIGSSDCWINRGNSTENNSQGDTANREQGPRRHNCLRVFRSPNITSLVPYFAHNGSHCRSESHHHRVQSNNCVFHHLQMLSASHCISPSSENEGIGNPNYWGPPPPYTRPASDDCGCTEPGRTMTTFQGMCSHFADKSLCDSPKSSSVSTPKYERQAESPTVLNEGDNSFILCEQHKVSSDSERKQDDTSIVEVHTPYIIKNDVEFHTLPTRNAKRKDFSCFKSISDIPSYFENVVPVPTKQVESDEDNSCYLNNKINAIKDLYNLRHGENVSPVNDSNESKSDNSLTDNTLLTCSVLKSSSCESYQPTIVELSSTDFKSSNIVATSPSTPVTENLTLTDMIYAHSMPNLTITSFYQEPSSGNTSTSQDFADFELDKDSTLHEQLDSISSDILSVPSLPRDDDDGSLDGNISPIQYEDENQPSIQNYNKENISKTFCPSRHQLTDSDFSSEFIHASSNQSNDSSESTLGKPKAFLHSNDNSFIDSTRETNSYSNYEVISDEQTSYQGLSKAKHELIITIRNISV